MSDDDRRTRRELLTGGAALLATGASSALAGCPQPGRTVFDDVGDAVGPGDGTDGPTEAPPPINSEPEYEDWFANVSNYQNRTAVFPVDTADVTVDVGVAGNGGYRAFDHPAIAVPVETTVTWEWTGVGGAHNVVATEGAFDSGDPASDSTTTFSHRFTEAGTYRYVCETHEGDGMRGTVTVYDPDA